MRLPPPRGPLSTAVLAVLAGRSTAESVHRAVERSLARVDDPCSDGDLQLALAACYELHYRGFDDAADDLEWDPGLIALRGQLERTFEDGLRALCPPPAPDPTETVGAALRRLVDTFDGPPLSTYVLRDATVEQLREFVVERSVYQLKEADPHTWALPRLHGRAKSALVEIQFDEYGGGRPGRMHAELFAGTMRALDLDDTYGAYWPVAGAETFAFTNLMTLFGLHRSHRAALLGQLAALEMDSTSPNRRYANGLRRLGLGPDATAYFDEHVEADAVHEQIAAVDLCGSFVLDSPDRATAAADVLWGAACGLTLEARTGARLLERWGATAEQRCA